MNILKCNKFSHTLFFDLLFEEFNHPFLFKKLFLILVIAFHKSYKYNKIKIFINIYIYIYIFLRNLY